MKSYQLIVFDADGTLRRCLVEGQPCPNRDGEWELIPGVRERLAQIDWGVTCAGIASNQGGVARGRLTEGTALGMLHVMVREAFGTWFPGGAPTAEVRICPHPSEGGCACRKPEPGMLLDIMRFFRVGAADTLFVGDMETDREAAARAGCDFAWAHEFFGWSAPHGEAR